MKTGAIGSLLNVAVMNEAQYECNIVPLLHLHSFLDDFQQVWMIIAMGSYWCIKLETTGEKLS